MVVRVSGVLFCLFPCAWSLRKQAHQPRGRMVELCAISESRRVKGSGGNSTKGPLRPIDLARINVVFCFLVFFQRNLSEKFETSALNHTHIHRVIHRRGKKHQNATVEKF